MYENEEIKQIEKKKSPYLNRHRHTVALHSPFLF